MFSTGNWSSDYDTNVKKVVPMDLKIYQVISDNTECRFDSRKFTFLVKHSGFCADTD